VTENPCIGPTSLIKKMQKYSIVVPYMRIYYGKKMALDMIYGLWKDSSNLLYTFKPEVEKACPGSIVEMKTLHAKTRCLKMSLVMRKPYKTEVTLLDREKREWRYPMDLQKRTCSCRQWQIIGLPCIHVLFFITSLHGPAAEID
jgi:hypothetical protein